MLLSEHLYRVMPGDLRTYCLSSQNTLCTLGSIRKALIPYTSLYTTKMGGGHLRTLCFEQECKSGGSSQVSGDQRGLLAAIKAQT